MADIRDIPTFEGVYKIDTEGNVTRILYGREKKMSAVSSGKYLQVGLSKDGVQRTYAIHRLLALTFLGNPRGYTQVNHKDGDKRNNSLDNLEWCSPSQNLRHAFKSGLRPNSIGGRHHKARKVICIDNGKTYDSISDACRGVGASLKTLWNSLNGKKKTYKGKVWKYL